MRSSRRSGLVGQVALLVLALVVDLALSGRDRHVRWGDGVIPLGVLVASAVACYAALLLRGRYPRIAYGTAWTYSVGWPVLMPDYSPFTAMLIVLHQWARHYPLRRGLPYLLFAAVPMTLTVFNGLAESHPGPAEAALAVLIQLVLWTSTWVVGRFGYRAAGLNSMREQLLVSEARLTQQQEQLRLARELHDIVSHTVGAIVLQAAGAERVAKAGTQDPRVTDALSAIGQSSTQAIRELRRLLGLLHQPSDLADDSERLEVHTLAELPALVETTRACGIHVEIATRGRPTALDPSVAHAVYRLLQEALANVARHGGRGAAAEIRFDWQRTSLGVTVCNRPGLGPSIPLEPGGYGIPGLRQRIAMVGGRFEAGPSTDGQFIVSADVPLSKVSAADG